MAEPCAQLFEPLGLLGRNLTVGHRAHIEQQVAIPARATDQHLQASGVGLDPVFVPAPGPLAAARDRHAGFPRALVVVCADALLGRIIISIGGKDLPVALSGAQVQTVVYDDPGLQLLDDLVGARLVVERFVPVPVEPEQVNAPALCEEFAHLRLHPAYKQRVALGAEVGVAPIHWREIPANAQALPPCPPGQLRTDVALERGVGDIVITGLAVPEEEAIAVLGGQHHVFYARGLREPCPFHAAEIGRVEVPVKIVVNLDRNLPFVRALGIGVGARPTDLGLFEADRSPVDEQTETPLSPPAEALGIGTWSRVAFRGLGVGLGCGRG